MNKAVIVLGAALLLAAWAAAGETNGQVIEPAPAQSAQQEDETQLAQRQRAAGIYTLDLGENQSATYQLTYAAPSGTGDALQSGVGRVLLRGGAAQTDPQRTDPQIVTLLQDAGAWDLVPQNSVVHVSLPGADVERVAVTFTPEPEEPQAQDAAQPAPDTAPADLSFPAQSVALTPDADGQLHGCTFPVTFTDAAGVVHEKLFCTIELTLKNGDVYALGLALLRTN